MGRELTKLLKAAEKKRKNSMVTFENSRLVPKMGKMMPRVIFKSPVGKNRVFIIDSGHVVSSDFDPSIEVSGYGVRREEAERRSRTAGNLHRSAQLASGADFESRFGRINPRGVEAARRSKDFVKKNIMKVVSSSVDRRRIS